MRDGSETFRDAKVDKKEQVLPPPKQEGLIAREGGKEKGREEERRGAERKAQLVISVE